MPKKKTHDRQKDGRNPHVVGQEGGTLDGEQQTRPSPERHILTNGERHLRVRRVAVAEGVVQGRGPQKANWGVRAVLQHTRKRLCY